MSLVRFLSKSARKLLGSTQQTEWNKLIEFCSNMYCRSGDEPPISTYDNSELEKLTQLVNACKKIGIRFNIDVKRDGIWENIDVYEWYNNANDYNLSFSKENAADFLRELVVSMDGLFVSGLLNQDNVDHLCQMIKDKDYNIYAMRKIMQILFYNDLLSQKSLNMLFYNKKNFSLVKDLLAPKSEYSTDVYLPKKLWDKLVQRMDQDDYSYNIKCELRLP